MNVKLFLPTVLFLVVALAAMAALNNMGDKVISTPSSAIAISAIPAPILFYGDICPHCKVVESHFDLHGIDARLGITRLEVYNDLEYGRLLESKAKDCGLATGEIGVPFLWTGSSCLVGDDSIIEFVDAKLGIN